MGPSKRPSAVGEAYVYVLACADGTLYCGWTTDVAKRLAAHVAGKGARYTRGRGPLTLLATWAFTDRRQAMAAEVAFKRLGRQSKLARIAAGPVTPCDPGSKSGTMSASQRSWCEASWV